MKNLICKIFGRKVKDTNINWGEINSVLIRPLGTGIGDGVVLSAVITQLKQAYPNCKIGVLTTARNEFIFKNIPGVNICLKDTPLTYLLNRKKWQVFLDYRPTFTTRNIICDYFLVPHYTICFEKTTKKHYSHKTVHNYNFYVPQLSAKHLSESLTLTPFAKYINAENASYNLNIPSQEQIETVFKWLKPNKKNILICPSGSDRILDKKLISEVIKNLEQKYSPNIILPLEKKHYTITTKQIIYTGKIPLETFLALCYKVDFIITIDTSTVHIACAYKKPFVSIYSGYDRNFKLFSPLKQENTYTVRSSAKAQDHVHKIDNWSVQEVIKYSEICLSKTKG